MRTTFDRALLGATLALVLLLPSACGSSSHTYEPTEPDDTLDARIQGTDPVDRTTGVPLLHAIRIAFDTTVESSAITEDTIRLWSEYGNYTYINNPIPCRVSLDASRRTATLTPREPLWPDMEHFVSLHGPLAYAAAPSLTHPPLRVITTFRTDKRCAKREMWCDPYQGTVLGYTGGWFSTDRLLRTGYRVQGEGPNQRFLDADDWITWMSRDAYNELGQTTLETSYAGPGPNGIWFDADDAVSRWQEYLYDAHDRVLGTREYSDPGPNGIWKDDDDPCDRSFLYSYDAEGFFRLFTDWDGLPDTVLDSFGTLTYDTAYGQVVLQSNGEDGPDSLGPDGMPGTEDDVIQEYLSRGYDAWGCLRIVAWYDGSLGGGPGPDGAFHTTDDEGCVGYVRLHADAAHRLVQFDLVTYPGPNALWFDADDVYDSFTVFVYDGDRMVRTEERSALTGAVEMQTTYGHDARGCRTHQIQANGPGPDGRWSTADDEITQCWRTISDRTGYEVMRVEYAEPGPDGVWLAGLDDGIREIGHYETLRKVHVFLDPAYVDTDATDDHAEGANVRALLDHLGSDLRDHTPSSLAPGEFMDPLVGSHVLAVPHLEPGADLAGDLQRADGLDALKGWIDVGGTLLLFGTSAGTLDLADAVLGTTLAPGGAVTPGLTLDATGAAGTMFEDALPGMELPEHVSALDPTALPTGARTIYLSPAGEPVVTLLPHGHGRVILLGWDLYDGHPSYGIGRAWHEAVLRAVLE